MRAVRRLSASRDNASTGTATLVDRYLGRSGHGRRAAFAGIPDDHPLSHVGLELIDTSVDFSVRFPERSMVLWHVLWVRDEPDATVTISSTGESHTWPIAPGDSVPVPRDATLLAAGGQLGLAIAMPDTDIASMPPTHGRDRFFGHNRQTTSYRTTGLRVTRWKLTQPLALGAHVDGPCLVMALARDAVIRASASIDRLTQGDVAVIDPAADPVILPDGLAYLLTVECT